MTVYRLIKSGELRAVRVGKSYRLREEDIDAYLSKQYTQQADAATGRDPPMGREYDTVTFSPDYGLVETNSSASVKSVHSLDRS